LRWVRHPPDVRLAHDAAELTPTYRGRDMMERNDLGRLLDIELEANIRFGAREMSLAELLEIGPGAVIPLDRQITDPVDLIIGDKVVARGEVVLVQGKFGLRVTEVLSG
jgi:flagellar motor switch protein FliN/FliY